MNDNQPSELYSYQSQPSVGFQTGPELSVEESNEQIGQNDLTLNLINKAELSNLNEFYDLESSLFKRRIEKLNLKFYWETENVIGKKQISTPYNKLFLILFKAINLYTDEIKRLNMILQENKKNEILYKNKITEFTRKEKERLITKQILKSTQKTNKILETKLKEKTKNEELLRNEIQRLKNRKTLSMNNSSILPCISNNINTSITIQSNNNSIYNTNFIKKQPKKINNRLSVSIESKQPRKNYKNVYNSTNKNNNISVDNKNITFIKTQENMQPQINNFINTSFDSGLITKNDDELLYTEKDTNNYLNDSLSEELISSCYSHFETEIDLLSNLEDFLERKKKDIRNAFTKKNFNSLKNTIKKISN